MPADTPSVVGTSSPERILPARSADSVAHRYAESVFESALADGRVDELAQGMAALEELITAHEELQEFLINPDVEVVEKLQVLQRVLGVVWSADLAAFLRMVLSMGRAAHLADIAQAFAERFDEARGIIRARVSSARPLEAPLKRRLKQILEHREHKQVELIEHTAPELLGGLQVVLGSRMLDGSVRAQLDTLKQRLKSVRVH